MDPDHSIIAYYNLGKIADMQQQPDLAVTYYLKVLRKTTILKMDMLITGWPESVFKKGIWRRRLATIRSY